MLPKSGSVLGVDVGGSLARRSTAICRLSWTADTVDWVIERSTAEPHALADTMRRVAGGHDLMVAAFDGPLTMGFGAIDRYRAAERMLTRGLGRHIGKPGQTNVPVGRQLNASANACVRHLLSLDLLQAAKHAEAIDSLAVVEAFPSSYMGLLLADPLSVAVLRANRSDRYFDHLAQSGRIGALLSALLPGRTPSRSPKGVVNHDDRSALICAITALGVAAGDYCAVGDADGWIFLPPLRFIAPWAQALLRANEAPDFTGKFVVRN